MRDIALYYPWTRVRDQTWLKAAALYWPRLAVLSPAGYPRGDAPIARALREELGFLVDVDPARSAPVVAREFLELIGQLGDSLVARYGWLADLPEELRHVSCHHDGTEPVDDERITWVHLGKLPPSLVQGLVEARLGVWSRDRGWLAMHPKLGSVYLAALAERVARANHLATVTDQPRHHGMLNGWTLETLTRLLLDDEPGQVRELPVEDVTAMYANVAIQTVVPAGLSEVPVERIVRARRVLAAEFDAFRGHLASLTDQLAELGRIEEPTIVHERLVLLVERDLRRSTADLERGLQTLGLEPARAVLGMKSMDLPTAAALAASGAGMPVAAGQAGMIAAQLVASGARAHQQARDLRRGAAGYLLGLREELNPAGVVDRVRRLFRRAADPATPTHRRS